MSISADMSALRISALEGVQPADLVGGQVAAVALCTLANLLVFDPGFTVRCCWARAERFSPINMALSFPLVI